MKIGDDIHSEVIEYVSSAGTKEKMFKRCIGTFYSFETEQIAAEFTCDWALD